MSINGITIVICCYNSESRIIPVLDDLAKLKNSKELIIDLVIVDNNSSDNTQKVVAEKWKELGVPFPINIVFEAQSGLIHARKRGIKNAKQDFILFVDDDNLLNTNYIDIGVSILESNEDIAVLGGFGIGQFETKLPDWINPGFPFKSLLGSLAVTTKANNKTGFLLDKHDFVFGASSFYKRKVFENLEKHAYKLKLIGRKGDELLSGEDQELCYLSRLMGYKIYRSKDLIFTHVIPKNRINKRYFEELYRGFGYSHTIVSLYSQLIDRSTIKFNQRIEIFKSKIRYFLYHVGYMILFIFTNRFFKLKLLRNFEKGRITFLENISNLTEVKKSLLSINEKLKVIKK